jgi:GH25 family lysozyme M1 (1,4-beta-N-acetylmuramidase)
LNSAFAQRPLGIDVSDYQSQSMSWTSVKSLGISFAWAKATEGLTLTDDNFTTYEANAKAAGVLIGAYHFAHPETHLGLAGADEEAAHFWQVASNYVKGSGTYMMPMLDIEQNVTTASPAYTKATLSAWVNEWCNDIVHYAASNGVTAVPVVYTFTSYATGTAGYGPGFDTSVTNWPLWMAQYPASPNIQGGAPSSTSPWPAAAWKFWQYSDSNSTPGTIKGIDSDVFNGTATSIGTYVVGGITTPSLTELMLSRAVDAGTNVSFTNAATGIAPITYQWRFGSTNISGATNAVLTLTNVAATNSGNYYFVARNASGSITSSPVSLVVYPPQATVFADDFDVNTATNWIINKSSSDNAVAFSFDYSTLGIPSAPDSTGGTTRGLQLKSDLTLGTLAALSVSPTNQSFSGDYRLHFDAWINVNGPFPGGGAGSTEYFTAGVGTSGKNTEWTGNASADGFYFSADGDGGVSPTSTTTGDYSAYKGATWENAASGIYAAGALDNTVSYYTAALKTGHAAPSSQQSAYSQQTGTLATGTFGFAWHDVVVSRRGNIVNWAVDGILLATITNASFTASNVFVGFWDPFTGATDNTNLNFALVDNVRVEEPAAAPAITTDPQPASVPLGAAVTFTAAATGLPAPALQWLFNGTNILGATNSSLTLTDVQIANVGNYSVIATNFMGTAAGTSVALTLIPPAAAQFQSIQLQPDGSLQISFTGDANTNWTYTIETSTNLTTWTDLTNLSSANGVFSFSLDSVTNNPQQFFRARSGQ